MSRDENESDLAELLAEIKALRAQLSAAPQPQPKGPAHGVTFGTELLEALGLGALRGVTDLRLDFEGLAPRVTVTQLVTRAQGAAVMALLQRKRFLLADPIDLGDRVIETSAPDLEFRSTPMFRRPEG